MHATYRYAGNDQIMATSDNQCCTRPSPFPAAGWVARSPATGRCIKLRPSHDITDTTLSSGQRYNNSYNNNNNTY